MKPTEQSPPRKAAHASARVHRLSSGLGPGLITGAADDDPSGISTYSVTGASFGYAPLWIALFSFPLMTSVELMCARARMVTGKGLAGAVRGWYSRTDPTGNGVPDHVEKELRSYLKCGILAHGFARARCAACGYDFPVAPFPARAEAFAGGYSSSRSLPRPNPTRARAGTVLGEWSYVSGLSAPRNGRNEGEWPPTPPLFSSTRFL